MPRFYKQEKKALLVLGLAFISRGKGASFGVAPTVYEQKKKPRLVLRLAFISRNQEPLLVLRQSSISRKRKAFQFCAYLLEAGQELPSNVAPTVIT